MNTYDPNDSNSSPYEPAMGQLTIYRLKQGEHYPAIITKTHDNDRVDLTIFTTYGMLYRQNVAYSGDEASNDTWYWAPERKERKPVKFEEDSEVAVVSESIETTSWKVESVSE